MNRRLAQKTPMFRTFVSALALASAFLAAVPAPVGGQYKIAFPHTALNGGTVSIPLAGPPEGLEVVQATWVVNYASQHGGTPASDLVLELSVPGLPMVSVTGADLGWPAAAGSFSGSLTTTAIAGVVGSGDSSTAGELFIHSTTGGVFGKLGGAILLEFAAVCQKDGGYAGPGNVQLSICGDPLFKGGHADLLVSGAPPFAGMLFMAGLVGGPIPFKGGTLVPKPRLLIVPSKTDASGSRHLVMPGGGANVIFFLQVAVVDPSQTNGVALSNGLIVELLP